MAKRPASRKPSIAGATDPVKPAVKREAAKARKAVTEAADKLDQALPLYEETL